MCFYTFFESSFKDTHSVSLHMIDTSWKTQWTIIKIEPESKNESGTTIKPVFISKEIILYD